MTSSFTTGLGVVFANEVYSSNKKCHILILPHWAIAPAAAPIHFNKDDILLCRTRGFIYS
jgi:hypothetical protein